MKRILRLERVLLTTRTQEVPVRGWWMVLGAVACTTYVDSTGAEVDTDRKPPGYDASCEEGTHCKPFHMSVFPYLTTGDTRDSDERQIDVYGCGPNDEAGAEVWYAAELDSPGMLVASVNEESGDGIDVDVHILGGQPESAACLDRDDETAEAWVDAGFVFVVVDTWRSSVGVEYPGPFELVVDFVPDVVTEPITEPDSEDTAVDTGTSEPDDTGLDDGPCPADMVAVEDYCIDRYEGHLVGHDPYTVPTSGVAANAEGVVPQGYISGEVAQDACEAAGKRLCSSDEWLRACEGPSGNTYPYGNTYDPDACNEEWNHHPIVEVFGSNAQWNSTEMNDPRLNQLEGGLAPSGEYAECVTDEGVFDMHGNLHEWVADPTGIFQGGFYVDASINGVGCSYLTDRHTFDYHDYSTGFRCCADQ